MAAIWGVPGFAPVASRVASQKSFCESRLSRPIFASLYFQNCDKQNELNSHFTKALLCSKRVDTKATIFSRFLTIFTGLRERHEREKSEEEKFFEPASFRWHIFAKHCGHLHTHTHTHTALDLRRLADWCQCVLHLCAVCWCVILQHTALFLWYWFHIQEDDLVNQIASISLVSTPALSGVPRSVATRSSV